MDRLADEVRTAMFLTGAETTDELRDKPVIVGGETKTWLVDLGYDPADFAGQRFRNEAQ
jgi:hypothetical protein